MKNVVIAMSGGVDSSVTAVLLKEEGYEVSAITMQLLPDTKLGALRKNIEDASGIADLLGIHHSILDISKKFEEEVIARFSKEYITGRTPNPCILCNQAIKFGYLLTTARKLGADYIATGHYARIEYNSKTGKYLLKKGIDLQKDQSYFLYSLTQQQLKSTLMPLGSRTKTEVKALAVSLGLPITNHTESQEICFIPSNNYRTFFTSSGIESPPGPIIDKHGTELGQHKGIIHYTIGQRRGLGISGNDPYYVTQIQRESNTIVIGKKEDAYFSKLSACNVNWITDPATEPIGIYAKIRSLHKEVPGTLIPVTSDTVKVVFEEPQWAITPGQAVVFYQGDLVLGGGTIDQAG